MKHLIVVVASLVVAPLAASAQPGGPPPPPPDHGDPGGYGGGYQGGGYYYAPPAPAHRSGFTIGFGLGLGTMEDDSGPIDCYDCGYSPVAWGLDFHIGGMLSPTLALVGEIWGQAQTLDSGGDALVQTMVLGAAQMWVTPQLWLKGGLGVANLSISYDDGYESRSDDIDSGGAIMGAIGYEILHSPQFALDLQLRLGAGFYEGIDEQISSGMFSVGFNWY